ncbi:MAG: transposase, partial [bacterium]|nr:transposase [bacterium]
MAIGCDFWGAYKKYMRLHENVLLQFCMADRFLKHGDSYFRFITTPAIEPTNNLAEQAIRFVVIDRRITQGTRGKSGRDWCERIWTMIATGTQRGLNVFDFLTTIDIVSLDGLILAQLAFRFRIAEQPGHPIPVPLSTLPQSSRHGIPRFTNRAVNG